MEGLCPSPLTGYVLLVRIISILQLFFPIPFLRVINTKWRRSRVIFKEDKPRLPLLSCRLSKAETCVKTSPSRTKWRHESCAVVATHVP